MADELGISQEEQVKRQRTELSPLNDADMLQQKNQHTEMSYKLTSHRARYNSEQHEL
jgi:hypothetical protein